MVSSAAIAERLDSFDEVLFLILFGSRADGVPRPDSDLDVAAYLDPRLSARQRFDVRLKLLAELEDLGPADVVILNEAPPLLAHQALLGKPIVMRDRQAFVRFFTRSIALAEDERHYREIHQAARRRRIEEDRFGRS